jgi:hypothetical protein
MDIRIAMLEIGRFLSIPEDRSLLNHQFHKLRVIVKKAQVSTDGFTESLQRVGHLATDSVHCLTKQLHAVINGSEEQRFLAGVVVVQSSLAEPNRLSDLFEIGCIVTATGEDNRSRF